MTARIFKRVAQVTFARPLNASELGSQQVQPNAIVVRDLRIAFRIEKSLRREPNEAEVIVTNLSEKTRSEVQQKPLYVRVDAGYDGVLETIFVGQLREAYPEKNGPDIDLRMQLADGDRAFRYARVNRSFEGGVTGQTALREIARSMGLRVNVSGRAEALLRAQYVSGLSLFGPSRDELTRVLGRFGLSWSIQDGDLQVLLPSEFRADDAIVVSPSSGLIGQPRYGAPERKGKKPILPIEMTLRPSLRPGSRISLESSTIRGVFKCERLMHVGDTHGAQWSTEAETRAA